MRAVKGQPWRGWLRGATVRTVAEMTAQAATLAEDGRTECEDAPAQSCTGAETMLEGLDFGDELAQELGA